MAIDAAADQLVEWSNIWRFDDLELHSPPSPWERCEVETEADAGMSELTLLRCSLMETYLA